MRLYEFCAIFLLFFFSPFRYHYRCCPSSTHYLASFDFILSNIPVLISIVLAIILFFLVLILSCCLCCASSKLKRILKRGDAERLKRIKRQKLAKLARKRVRQQKRRLRDQKLLEEATLIEKQVAEDAKVAEAYEDKDDDDDDPNNTKFRFASIYLADDKATNDFLALADVLASVERPQSSRSRQNPMNQQQLPYQNAFGMQNQYNQATSQTPGAYSGQQYPYSYNNAGMAQQGYGGQMSRPGMTQPGIQQSYISQQQQQQQPGVFQQQGGGYAGMTQGSYMQTSGMGLQGYMGGGGRLSPQSQTGMVPGQYGMQGRMGTQSSMSTMSMQS